MKRYNIFYQVHKGLRVMLYETATQLQQTDFSNNVQAEAALEQVKAVTTIFEKHAYTEDTLIFSAVKRSEPSVVAAFEQEHVKDHELGERLNGLIQAFSSTETSDSKSSLGHSLNIAFTEFLVFNIEHMAKEEDIINKLLWRYYSDEELHEITNQILANIPPAQMALFSKWMMRGLSNNEIVDWLKEVKKTAPDFVYTMLMKIAEDELNIFRLREVEEALAA